MSSAARPKLWQTWTRIAPGLLPFADAASETLPLGRLLRLSLFQVSVGMATVLLIGTLNRVLIVEMGVGAWLVAALVALPILVAPFRALIGFRSDTHRSVLGWRRVPYIWLGTWLQFGGLAIMPFALILLSGDITHGPWWIGHASAALAFLMVGAGMQTVQTAGLALATDIAPEAARPRVVALMYVMLLAGMVVSAAVFGLLLAEFSQVRLVKVVQGTATATMVLNLIALWKQEPRVRGRRDDATDDTDFRGAWAMLSRAGRVRRFLVATGLGTAAFSMQDIVLEPYGGEILHLGVGATTALTAVMAIGSLVAFGLAARWLGRGADPLRLSGLGVVVGLFAFSAVIFAEPFQSATLFRIGVLAIGVGGGLFAVGTLTAAMALDTDGFKGLALGAWGGVQATCAGLAIAAGGGLRDAVASLAERGVLGEVLAHPATGYAAVYHVELLLLFTTLIAIGPLVRSSRRAPVPSSSKFGLPVLPG
ncbi:MAG: BCD family MFS transporter [Burkholderiales bacterium]|jgi:BCD family chlorophyll transporter-like MFS transporter